MTPISKQTARPTQRYLVLKKVVKSGVEGDVEVVVSQALS
jgi:hypothetical protein